MIYHYRKPKNDSEWQSVHWKKKKKTISQTYEKQLYIKIYTINREKKYVSTHGKFKIYFI